MTVRLAHFSDVHLTARRLGWTVRDVFGKRTTGWVNVERCSAAAGDSSTPPSVVDVLRRDFATRGFDHLVFSGDATMLASIPRWPRPRRRSASAMQPLPPGIAVPGNHDVYVSAPTRGAARSRPRSRRGSRASASAARFTRCPEGRARLADRAELGQAELLDVGRDREGRRDATRALPRTLREPRRRPADRRQPLPDPDARSRIPEPRFHRLRDWERVRDTAAECGVSLWLHGHEHGWYVLPAGENLPFATICAGSSTQTKKWGYHEYTIEGSETDGPAARVRPRDQCVPGS